VPLRLVGSEMCIRDRNSIIRNHPVEEVGAWLRESMTAMKKIV
jgi:hypothetical protein